MNPLLVRLVRMGARRLAANPKVREASARAARAAVEEAGRIARDRDRPRAAGRAVRRAWNALQGGR